jgi:hypothetical protein
MPRAAAPKGAQSAQGDRRQGTQVSAPLTAVATQRQQRGLQRRCSSWPYQAVEKPPHTFTRGEALKE